VDLFLLSVPEGGLLEISTDEPGDGSCKRQGFSDSPVGLLDSELRLLTPEGALLAVNDNGPGDGFCSRLQAKVTGGSYLIQVRASSAAPAQVFSYLLRVSLPLSGTSMHPRHALRLAALASSLLLACGDAGLSESSDNGCVAAPCSPVLGPGGGSAGGAGSDNRGGFAGGAGQGEGGGLPSGAGGSGISGGGGTSPAGGSSGGEQSPTEGACAACYQALCEPDGVPGCACAASRCAQQCSQFLGESCPIPGAGGAGGAAGAAGAGGSAPGGVGGSGNDPALEKDCTDTLDNNGSNQIDCEDLTCEAACKDMCFDPPSLELGPGKPGSLQGHTSVFQANCVPVAQLGFSVAYRFDAPGDGWLSLSLSSEGDLALSAHKGECKGGGYSFCRNVVGAGGTEALVVEVKKGEPWFVVLTEGTKSQPKTFTLQATFETPVCGDGKLSNGEQCDDGNVLDGDGCSADCKNDSCDNAPALEDKLVSTLGQAPAPTVVSGTLAGGVSSLQASCSKLGVASPERVHAFRAANPGRLEVSVVPTTPGEDLILSVRSSCAPQGELSCADATQGGGPGAPQPPGGGGAAVLLRRRGERCFRAGWLRAPGADAPGRLRGQDPREERRAVRRER
jgi:cysteine-rich repeat protein